MWKCLQSHHSLLILVLVWNILHISLSLSSDRSCTEAKPANKNVRNEETHPSVSPPGIQSGQLSGCWWRRRKSPGGGRAGPTYCLFERSRRPGHLTGTRTSGCPASPSRAGSCGSPAASTSGTSSLDFSCVSCTCAATEIISLQTFSVLLDNNVWCPMATMQLCSNHL